MRGAVFDRGGSRGLRLGIGRALRFGDALLRLGRAELDPLRDAHHALVDLGHDPLAFLLGELLPLPLGHELPHDVAPHRSDVDHDAIARRGVGIDGALGARRGPAIGKGRWKDSDGATPSGECRRRSGSRRWRCRAVRVASVEALSVVEAALEPRA